MSKEESVSSIDMYSEEKQEENSQYESSYEGQVVSDEISETTEEIKSNKEDMDLVHVKQVTFFEAVMNSLNSVLGAGILSVPISFISVGIIPSVILICMMALLSYAATIINVRLHIKYDASGYDEIVQKLMGKIGCIIYSIITIIFLWSGMIAFVIIAGDTIISWFAFGGIDISHFKYRCIMILIYSLVIPVALSIPKNFRVIGIFSTFSIGFIFFYAIVSIIKFCQIIPKYGVSPTMKLAQFNIQIFSSLSIYSSAFSLPCVIIPILTPYPKIYKKRRNVVISSFVISSFLTIIPSTLLYLVFGEYSQGNILNSFPSNDILFTVVRVGFFLIVSFSFPVIAKSCMSNWSHLIFKINNIFNLNNCQYWSIFTLTCGVPVILAMLLPQCNTALAIGGALGVCLGCYAYPSILSILSSKKKCSVSNIPCGIFAAFGICLSAIATYTSIVDAINAFKTNL